MDYSAGVYIAHATIKITNLVNKQYELVKVHLVERWGFEPQTPCLQSRCSPN
jgi:hypothetical protein